MWVLVLSSSSIFCLVPSSVFFLVVFRTHCMVPKYCLVSQVDIGGGGFGAPVFIVWSPSHLVLSHQLCRPALYGPRRLPSPSSIISSAWGGDRVWWRLCRPTGLGAALPPPVFIVWSHLVLYSVVRLGYR